MQDIGKDDCIGCTGLDYRLAGNLQGRRGREEHELD